MQVVPLALYHSYFYSISTVQGVHCKVFPYEILFGLNVNPYKFIFYEPVMSIFRIYHLLSTLESPFLYAYIKLANNQHYKESIDGVSNARIYS